MRSGRESERVLAARRLAEYRRVETRRACGRLVPVSPWVFFDSSSFVR